MARQARSLQILEEFKAWLDTKREKPAGQESGWAGSDLYRESVDRAAALLRVGRSVDLSIYNNAAEWAMRPCAISHKNNHV